MAIDGCPICEAAQPTTWILTHLNPPATVQSCEEHIVLNLITLLAIQLDMPIEVLYEIIETGISPVEEPAAPEPEQPAAAAPKRGRKPKLAAEPEPEVVGDAVEA